MSVHLIRSRPHRHERRHHHLDIALPQAGDILPPIRNEVDSVIVPQALDLVATQSRDGEHPLVPREVSNRSLPVAIRNASTRCSRRVQMRILVSLARRVTHSPG
jgi:hypothetical protein